MSAIIYKQLGEVELVRRPKPQIQAPGDAIVKVLHASICGTDLHILQGHVPTCQPGRILGHEGVGIIESLGAGVTSLSVGDKVLIACISSCGVCTPCRGGLSAHCSTGGWILGHTIDGTQAEYVRVPHAACSLFPLSADVSVRAALPLSDSVPTAYDVGLLPGNIKPGAKVAIVGAGPVALALVMLAKLYTPKCIVVIGRGGSRLETAKTLGADYAFSVLDGDEAAVQSALEVTNGGGFDLVSECVGSPESFDICQRLLAIGGTLTNAGVHGCQVKFDLHDLWSKNINIESKLVSHDHTSWLIDLVQSNLLDPQLLVSHVFPLTSAQNAYTAFKAGSKEGVLKVAIEM
ncbi:chaperonin 10-like protein [Stachybotrys elegans]|uniref:Chaperonin 10-like protein n=1 Tax=Stachybotrys elegans TaxID=80388 RepID=A0A8K0SF58_9HYPO|nr:chaperonin 10-like protein [Stachybotrys elegans]